MNSKVVSLILLLKILHLTAADLVKISSNKTTTISRERNSYFIDYFNLLVNTHDQLQDKVNTLESSNQILGVQIVNAESKIINDTSIINSKDQEIKSQLNEIKKRDEQVKDINEQLHLQDEQIKDKTAELRERDEKLNNITEVNQKLKDQLLECEGKIKEESELSNVREQQIKEANEILNNQNIQLSNKITELKESEEKVNNMTNIIQNLQSQLDEEIETHNDQIQLKVNEISNLTYQIQNKDDIVFNTTETIQSLNSQLTNAETEIKEKCDLINSKDEDLKKQDEQLKMSNEQFSKQNEQLSKENEQLELQNEQFSKENEQLRLQNEQLMNKCEQLKQKDALLVSKNNEINMQSEQIKNNEILISSLNNHIELVTSELKDKTNQLLTCSTFQRCPKGLPNGISSIELPGEEAFKAPCNSSGWMTIQKRFDGSEDFHRNWAYFKQGFGHLRGEFFIGLEKLHQLTKVQPYELLIKLGDQYGNNTYARYDDFQIGSEEESYYLKSLGHFSGNTMNGLNDSLGMKFSTYDRDNDKLVSDCAKHLGGAWWFNKCGSSSLNGKYYKNGGHVADGIFWPIFVGGKWKNNISYTHVKMMIKPKDF